jgi:hypothetical protein
MRRFGGMDHDLIGGYGMEKKAAGHRHHGGLVMIST